MMSDDDGGGGVYDDDENDDDASDDYDADGDGHDGEPGGVSAGVLRNCRVSPTTDRGPRGSPS